MSISRPIADQWIVCSRAARAPHLRTMRQFAEDEIVIPNGPYRGRKFRADRQPYAGMWLDAVDSGKWPRIVSTGPTQSGKTLTCFVIPTLYHLFECGETVVCGLPNMDMAGDKWLEDFEPVIRLTKYRDLIPTQGAGSRGGRVESIRFRNGATLRFMAGGGGDKARAGFTTRVLVVSETDGMDESASGSDEADKITQLEARTRAYGSRRRIYLECTVTTDEGRTWREYEGGTKTQIVLKCPHCGSGVVPEREHLKGWQDATTVKEAATNAHFVCPDCGVVWSEADRVAAHLDAYLKHQNNPDDTDTLGFRWSGVNNLFALAGDLGADEWKGARAEDEDNAERELHQFVWCLPFAGDRMDLSALTREGVAKRSGTALGKGLVPADTTYLTAFMDLGKFLCHWALSSYNDVGVGRIPDYGRIDVPSDDMEVKRALTKAMDEFAEMVEAGWVVYGETERAVPGICGIDAGWESDLVYRWCRTQNQRLGRRMYVPCKGYGFGQNRGKTSTYMEPKKRGNTVSWLGDRCHLARLPDKGTDLLHIDADHWKSTFHNRLRVPEGEPGAVSLYFVNNSAEHTSFSAHLTAEREEEVYHPGTGMVKRWVKVAGRKANHWLDAVVGATCLAYVSGLRIVRDPEVRAANAKKMKQPIGTPMPDGRKYLVSEREA